MKIKEGFILKKVGIQYVVAAAGEGAHHHGGILRLNETGTFAFRALQAGATMEELVQAVTEEYDVSRERAQADAEAFLRVLEKAGILA